jgi:hypothetical protein
MELYVINILSTLFGDMSYLFDFPRSIIYPTVAILFLIAFNPKDMYDAWKLFRALEINGELPPRLAELPVHITSIEKYSNIKEKIERFKEQVMLGEPSRIFLTSDDLNDLYLQGNSINKYHADWQGSSIGTSFSKYNNCFICFEISNNNYILRRHVNYIDSTMPGGIRSNTDKIIFFISDNNEVRFRQDLIEINGKYPFKFVRDNVKKEFLIKGCDLLESIFRCSFDFSMTYLESNDYRIFLSIIDKITNIEISNGSLMIEANGNVPNKSSFEPIF